MHNAPKPQPKAHCRRCHAALHAPRSITRGYGDRCWRLQRQEAAARAAGFKPTAVEKARELIEARAILPIRGRRIFQVVSSDGTATYKTAPQACTCPAGIKGRYGCYHRAAATMLAA